jgi:hypothetical protein
MAAIDFKPAQKPHVYDLLGRLNASFARVTRNLSELENVGIFEIYRMRKLYHLTKELQANANFHLTETLRDAEQRDWSEFGRAGREKRE